MTCMRAWAEVGRWVDGWVDVRIKWTRCMRWNIFSDLHTSELLCIIGRRVNKINWVTRSCGCLCASRPACTSGTSCCHRDETTCGRQSLHLLKGRVRVMSGKESALRLLQIRHGCLHQHHTPHICELPAHLKQGFHAFKSRFGLKR